MRNLLELVRQIRDYNADASKAVSNVLRLANSGWDLQVYQPDGETPDEEGRALIDTLVDPLSRRVATEYGGGINVLLDMIHLTAATQGAASLEIELTPGVNDIADLIVVNPWIIDFQQNDAGVFVPGIRRMGAFTPLHPLQFRYVPLDPEPGDPRGRSPFWAALDIVFFQMEVLRDLKAAAHFAGYPRIDISVAWDAVYKTVSETRPDLLDPGQAESLRAWLDAYLGDITDYMETLNPDDAFVHYDSVTSQYVVPTGKTMDVRELISVIDQQIVSGLKQLPVLLGRNEGATTTHATVQWQVYVRELASYQRISRHLLSYALTFALRVWGRQGVVRLEYDSLRTTDREAEARAELSETQAKMLQVREGWISNDEAAQTLTGHDAVAAPVPEPAPSDADTDPERSIRLPAGGEADSRSLWEDVRNLPTWQQALYNDGDRMAWETYRQQARDAWRALDVLVQAEESGRISPNGNGHQPCTDCDNLED